MKLRVASTLAGLLLSGFAAAAQEKAEYSIDQANSKLEIRVYKAGLFKALGHDHLIAAREISGQVLFDARKIENSSVRFKIETKSLTVVDPGESEKDRRDVQATMTGVEVLDTAKCPEIVFSSTNVSAAKKTADGWDLTLAGKLDLHGVEKPVSLPLRVHLEASRLGAQGEVSLLQTEYGITPVKIASGSVKVKDKLNISFTIITIKRNP
jgi:polyisoprenoid-binding protein YceI